jgi:hypothetical protein
MAIFNYNPRKRKTTTNCTAAGQKRRRFAVRGTYATPVYKTVSLTAPSGKTEIKYDYGSVSAVVPSGGVVARITSIAAGPDFNQRIGRLINYYAFKGKYNFSKNNTSTGHICTVSVVYDYQTNGVVPTLTEIFQDSGPNSLIKSTNRNRFKILWQRTHQMAHNGIPTEAVVWNPQAHGDISINLKGKKCSFYGSSNGYADIDSGGLFITVSTNLADASAFHISECLSFYE